MVVLLLVCTFLTTIFMDWTLVEGVYFWFITFTTVGFGDYVAQKPSKSIKPLYISKNHTNQDKSSNAGDDTTLFFIDLFYIFELMIGLCIVSSVLNSIMAAIEERKCRPQCPGCVPRKSQNYVENEQHSTPEQDEGLSMENYGFQKENNGSLSLTEIKRE